MFATFKNIFIAAAITSLLSGLLLTLVQQIQVIPIILEAEKYEQAAMATSHPPTEQAKEATSGGHGHADEEEWLPQDGLERNFFTASANIVIAFAFTLLMAAIASFRGMNLDWRSGLLFGIAGYAIFFIAPSLGLPPELPGSHLAALENRQLWWVTTVLCTGGGFAFVFFSKQQFVKIFGVALIIIPHVIGAPPTSPSPQRGTCRIATNIHYRHQYCQCRILVVLGWFLRFFLSPKSCNQMKQ